jgi:nuclear polyadenylated RNA-binding protein 3
MNSGSPSEPPEEPLQRSEPALLSPASPKPLHFPQPTNIPVLDMQMDVAFNQTEPHMADPSMHNTDVRPDFWRDPNEPPPEAAADHASPYSTGAGEAAEPVKEEAGDQNAETVEAGQITDSSDTAANGATQPQPSQLPTEVSDHVNGLLSTLSHVKHESTAGDAAPPSSDPSIPAADTATSSDGAPSQVKEEPAEQEPPTSAPALPGNVDVQALLDTLAVPSAANVVKAESSPTQPPAPGVEGTPVSASSLGAPAGNLPERPPPQEQPLIHPNYVHSQHIRDYHPHAVHSAFQPQHARTGSQGNVADPSSRNFVPPVHSPSSPATAAGSQAAPFYNSASPTSAAHAIPTPTSAKAHNSADATPIESRRESKLNAGVTPTAEERPWDASIQAKYDRFIEAERGYVSEGRWEQFPQGSRLFVGMRKADGSRAKKGEFLLTDDVGNLSSEKVTKRDIFHVFHSYGELAQISIKQAYGFVQFLRTEDCKRALEGEQGTWIRDKRIREYSICATSNGMSY